MNPWPICKKTESKKRNQKKQNQKNALKLFLQSRRPLLAMHSYRPLLAMWSRRVVYYVCFKSVDTIIVAVLVLSYNATNWVVSEYWHTFVAYKKLVHIYYGFILFRHTQKNNKLYSCPTPSSPRRSSFGKSIYNMQT